MTESPRSISSSLSLSYPEAGSLPSDNHRCVSAYEREPNYPLNYEPSLPNDVYEFPQSLLLTSHRASKDIVNEKESFPFDEKSNDTVPQQQLVEASIPKELLVDNEALHCYEANQKAQADAQYRSMKMKYYRSVAVPITTTAIRSSSILYAASFDNLTELERDELVEKRRYDNDSTTPLAISFACENVATPPAAITPPPQAGSGKGLLSRLLSNRSTATPSISSCSSITPSSSSISLSSLATRPSSPVTASSSSSSSGSSSPPIPFVRRTSPISIPKRVEAPCDGVRYRKAVPNDRSEQRSVVSSTIATTIVDKKSVMVDGEFTFSDVFQPCQSLSSTRSIAIPAIAQGRHGRRPTVVIPSFHPSSSVSSSHAPLPSSLLDGFLAL